MMMQIMILLVVSSLSTASTLSTFPKEKKKKRVHYRIFFEKNQQNFMYENLQKKNRGSLIKSPKTDTIINVSEEIENGLNQDKNLTYSTGDILSTHKGKVIIQDEQFIKNKNQLSNEHIIETIDDSERYYLSRSLRQRISKALLSWQEFIHVQSSWSWVILIAGFLTYSIGEALTCVFPLLFVALQEEFKNEGSSRLAWVQSMMNSVPCLVGPIASTLTTHLGYRKTTMLGGFIASMSLLASSFARKLEILYVTIGFCYSFGNSLVLVTTVVAVTEHFEHKPSFASGVTISGGAFGQCVFAIVLQKLINHYKWYGALMLFSGIVFLTVALGALFREVEYDEDEEDEEEEVDGENTKKQGEDNLSEHDETPMETLKSIKSTKDKKVEDTNEATIRFNQTSNHTIDVLFSNKSTKSHLHKQYSKSELCVPTAFRQNFEDEYLHKKTMSDEYQLNHENPVVSTNPIDQQVQQNIPMKHADSYKEIVHPKGLVERLSPSSLITSTNSKSNNPTTRKYSNVTPSTKLIRRTQRSASANNYSRMATAHHYPFYRQHHYSQHQRRRNSLSFCHHPTHHHSHHTSVLQCNYGAKISQLRLCSKNIYNYESLLNICKLQNLYSRIDRSLSCPNLVPSKQLISFPPIIDKDKEEKTSENPLKFIYRELCQLAKVLKILPFLLLCFSVTIITIFYEATWTFLVDYMNKNNLSDNTGSHIILAVGIILIFGEIGFGYMGDSKRIHPLYLYACSLTISGLCQSLIPFAIKSSSKLLPLMLFIGFLQSAQEVLMPILCIKFAGVTNFPRAYGMLLFGQGFSNLIGPPLLGAIADRMGSYDLTYYTISIGTVVASSFLFTMPLVQKYYKCMCMKKKTNSSITSGESGESVCGASSLNENGITQATSSSFINNNSINNTNTTNNN